MGTYTLSHSVWKLTYYIFGARARWLAFCSNDNVHNTQYPATCYQLELEAGLAAQHITADDNSLHLPLQVMTQRGRLCVSVRAGRQGELPRGSVKLSASRTGATLYIEPAPLVTLNNAEASLAEEERFAQDEVLRQLAASVARHSKALLSVSPPHLIAPILILFLGQGSILPWFLDATEKYRAVLHWSIHQSTGLITSTCWEWVCYLNGNDITLCCASICVWLEACDRERAFPLQVMKAVVELDIITARAQHAAWIGGVAPAFDDSRVHLPGARHPLLLQPALPPLPETPEYDDSEFATSFTGQIASPLGLATAEPVDVAPPARRDPPQPVDLCVPPGKTSVIVTGPNTGQLLAELLHHDKDWAVFMYREGGRYD